MDFLSTNVLNYLHITTLRHEIDKLINLNKPDTLKQENNAETMKTWLSINCQAKKYLPFPGVEILF